MDKPRILDCTLRDGSYSINFQFTGEDTARIAGALEKAGLDMIEIGHGMGLGASEKGMGVAAAADSEYMAAAAGVLQSADWGMFCIPGIATLEHIDLAAEYGMTFIRVGTQADEYRKAEPYIQRAKGHGMYVCANFMKSYVEAPHDFARYAIEAEKFGADLVYIVDSAGGMFPEELASYIEAIREHTDTLKLGFHGHHNLGMGVANSLRAVELGIAVVDTSLQGLGRGAGNAPTEQVLCALIRKGIDMNIDPIAVMDIGERYVQPLINSRGLSSVDTVSGLALFHSAYMNTIESFATKYRVDPRRLIVAVTERDKAEAPDELVEEVARQLAAAGDEGCWKPIYAQYYGREQD